MTLETYFKERQMYRMIIRMFLCYRPLRVGALLW